MKNHLLQIRSLHAALETGHELLRGLDLTIYPGETHVIMGPNGAGKSTLASVIMGHPDYEVTQGELLFEGESLLEDSTDVRARKGIFLSFQSPEEVEGITVSDFLRSAKQAQTAGPFKSFSFGQELARNMALLDFDESYATRYLNVGFSGGEKKKHEILQMLTLAPKLAILDETDSGLDVDAVKTVTQGVRQFTSEDNALLIISHNTKLLEDLPVDFVHILVDGAIVHTGDKSLIASIQTRGFGAYSRISPEA